MLSLQQRIISRLGMILIALSVISCQSTMLSFNNDIPINSALILDSAFPNYQNQSIETEEQVFAIDDEMAAMVREKLLVIRDNKRRAKNLLKHLFSKDNVDLAYISSANLTAIESYHSKVANCMSLTIMAYALAKEAGLDVKFQDVKVPEYWVRNGQYNMLTGHVNIVITEPKDPHKLIFYGEELLEIDFDPAINRRGFPKRIIDKSTVLAMFYNNKGADALVEQQYDLAYAYFKKSIQVAPGFAPVWGNLGILYKLNQHNEIAEQAYQYAISLDNDNLTVMGNLAFLLKQQGKTEQAAQIRAQIHNKRISNPYYHALLADEAFFRGDNENALHHYKQAIRMNKKVHEFHFGIAKVYHAMNEYDKAENAMKKAIAYNRASIIEAQYIAKLNFLKQADASD